MADGRIDKRPRSGVGGTAHDFLHEGDDWTRHLASQFAVAPTGVNEVESAAELLDGVLASDLAEGKYFEELAHRVAGAHAGGRLLFVVEVGEDFRFFALVKGDEFVEFGGDCMSMSADGVLGCNTRRRRLEICLPTVRVGVHPYLRPSLRSLGINSKASRKVLTTLICKKDQSVHPSLRYATTARVSCAER
jgi:hypothetical protein